jgi:hypothetical protein
VPAGLGALILAAALQLARRRMVRRLARIAVSAWIRA